MDQSKASNRRQAPQAKVTLNLKPCLEITPAWRRLWQLLLSPGPGPGSKGDSNKEQFTGTQQDAEAPGEADPQDYFQ